MGRNAGDSGWYDFAPLDATGQPSGRGFRLPSVTTILDALPKYLAWWGYRMGAREGRRLATDPTTTDFTEEQFYEHIKKLGREGTADTPSSTLEDAADRGTDVHAVAERFLKGQDVNLDAVPDDQKGFVTSFFKWWDANAGEVIATEVCVYSLDHRYAGTLDVIVKYAGNKYMVWDFKTSKDVYANHQLQSAAYLWAAQERGYIPENASVGAGVVSLRKSGNPKPIHVDLSINTLEVFLNVKRTWEWLNEMGATEKGR